ncbi:hypothetical protein, conserved, partial [Eimeria acervulina]
AVGHGDPSAAPNVPTLLRVLRGKGVSKIACGGPRSLALCNASSKSAAGAPPPNSTLLGGPQMGAPVRGGPQRVGGPQRGASKEGGPLRGASKEGGSLKGAPKEGGPLRGPSKEGGLQWGAPEGTGSGVSSGIRSSKSEKSANAAVGLETEGFYKGDTSTQRRQQQMTLQAMGLQHAEGDSRELDAAMRRIEALEAKVKAAEERSADAGDRLCTLRQHYEQHVAELKRQLVQQEVQFHAALAARSSSSSSSNSSSSSSSNNSQAAAAIPPATEEEEEAAAAALAQHFSLEETLADPLGTNSPPFFLLRRSNSSSSNSSSSSTGGVTEGAPFNPSQRIRGGPPKAPAANSFLLPLSAAAAAAAAAAGPAP